MSDVSFTLGLAGDVSDFTQSVQDEIKQAIAIQAGVGASASTHAPNGDAWLRGAPDK